MSGCSLAAAIGSMAQPLRATCSSDDGRNGWHSLDLALPSIGLCFPDDSTLQRADGSFHEAERQSMY